ncbi:hypothetical protein [Flavihumibacter solisilvae]|jgi:hypothetical protein|nr:hypothetical protein [Flavihumibacter solisilvae]
MKGKLCFVLTGIVMCMLLSPGCYNDVLSPGSDPNGPPQFVSFSGDLIPLFNTHCNGTGCHDEVPAHAPSLVPEKAYTSLMSGGYVNTAVPNSSTIYTVVQSGSMPPTGALKPSDAQLILDWIRNGAPNN